VIPSWAVSIHYVLLHSTPQSVLWHRLCAAVIKLLVNYLRASVMLRASVAARRSAGQDAGRGGRLESGFCRQSFGHLESSIKGPIPARRAVKFISPLRPSELACCSTQPASHD
jgi:hypothetical protein